MALTLAGVGGLMAIAGGVANLIGAIQGPGQVSPELMNPEQVNALMRKVNDALARAQAGQEVSLQEVQSLQGELDRFQGEFANIQEQMEGQVAPSEQDAYNLFLQRIPEYQRIATEAAQQAASPYADQREIAERRAQEAARMAQSVSAQQGNLYSGQAATAMGQAAGQELSAYEQALANIYGGTFGQQFGQLAGQGQQLARQDVQQEFANEMARMGALMQNIQAQAGITGQQQQAALGQAGLFQDQLNTQQQIQAQLMGPQFSTPTFISNPMTGIGSALTGLGAGIQGFQQTQQAQGQGFQQQPTQEPTQMSYFNSNFYTPRGV